MHTITNNRKEFDLENPDNNVGLWIRHKFSSRPFYNERYYLAEVRQGEENFTRAISESSIANQRSCVHTLISVLYIPGIAAEFVIVPPPGTAEEPIKPSTRKEGYYWVLPHEKSPFVARWVILYFNDKGKWVVNGYGVVDDKAFQQITEDRILSPDELPQTSNNG